MQPTSQPFYTQFIDYTEEDLLQEKEDVFRQRCVDSDMLWDSIRTHTLLLLKRLLIITFLGLCYFIKLVVWGGLFTVSGIIDLLPKGYRRGVTKWLRPPRIKQYNSFTDDCVVKTSGY